MNESKLREQICEMCFGTTFAATEITPSPPFAMKELNEESLMQGDISHENAENSGENLNIKSHKSEDTDG